MDTNIDAKSKKPYNYCNLRKIIYHQYLPISIDTFDLMGAQFDRLRYWNGGTAKGTGTTGKLQQRLPFTVLKLLNFF